MASGESLEGEERKMRYYTMSNRRFWTADLHLGHAKVAELREHADSIERKRAGLE